MMDQGPPKTPAILLPLFYGLVTGLTSGLSVYWAMMVAGEPHADWVGKAVGFAGFCLMYTLGQLMWTWILAKSWDWGRLPYDPNVRPIPPPAQPSLLVLKQQPSGGDYIKLPATIEQQRIFASKTLAGTPPRHRNWTGPGRIFSSSSFSHFLDELVQQGLAERQPGGRIEFSEKGQAYLKSVASPPPPSRP